MENNINLAPPYYKVDTLKTYIPYFLKNKYKSARLTPDYKSLPYYIKYAANGFEEVPDQQSKKLTDFLPVRKSGTFNYLDLISSATGAIPSYIIGTVTRNNRNAGNK